MTTGFETKGEHKMNGKQEEYVQYVRYAPSFVDEENFEGYYLDHSDLQLAEVLQDHETLYQSLQKNTLNHVADLFSRNNSVSDHGHGKIGRIFGTSSFSESQLALDETVARSLQEPENHLARSSLSGTTATASNAFTSTGTYSLAARLEEIDPDKMTYEELQSLGESIGTESKGLSDEIISLLPSSTYKIGFFSRKDKHECVICCMPYKKKEVLVTLPCQHQYHSECITRWLKINKACPVCNEEVFGS